MTDKYILDSAGNPVATDLMEWARWFETANRIVARDRLPGDVEVSTVFLGLDHSWGSGPPILWETMVFGGPLDGEQDRYTSLADAKAGHLAMLDRARSAPAVSVGGATP